MAYLWEKRTLIKSKNQREISLGKKTLRFYNPATSPIVGLGYYNEICYYMEIGLQGPEYPDSDYYYVESPSILKGTIQELFTQLFEEDIKGDILDDDAKYFAYGTAGGREARYVKANL